MNTNIVIKIARILYFIGSNTINHTNHFYLHANSVIKHTGQVLMYQGWHLTMSLPLVNGTQNNWKRTTIHHVQISEPSILAEESRTIYVCVYVHTSFARTCFQWNIINIIINSFVMLSLHASLVLFATFLNISNILFHVVNCSLI